MKTKNICINIAKDFETRFDTSNYELDRPLPRRKTLSARVLIWCWK